MSTVLADRLSPIELIFSIGVWQQTIRVAHLRVSAGDSREPYGPSRCPLATNHDDTRHEKNEPDNLEPSRRL